MPTYDYVCEKCGHRFEVFQSMTAPKLTDCPEKNCGGAVRRLLGTGAGVIFKGGGFYETDYRSESYKKAARKEAEGTKPEGGSGGTDKTGKKDAGGGKPGKSAGSGGKADAPAKSG